MTVAEPLPAPGPLDPALRERLREHLDPVRELAREAGARILDVYQSDDFGTETKDDDSPLTRADREAHRVIDAGLRRLADDVPRLSEEGAPPDTAQRRAWPRYWLIDPLDGTREFLKRNGEFTVNIAWIEGGQPVFGVVHAPALDQEWVGLIGDGAWRYEAQQPSAIATRPFAARPQIVVSRSHRDPATERVIERLPEHDALSVGSSLKICRVAEGVADLYPRFGPTSEWDTGAAQAVLEAAGGAVITPDCAPMRYNNGDGILNPDFLAVGDRNHEWSTLLRDLPWERRR